MLLEERYTVTYVQLFLTLLLQNRNHFELVEKGISISCPAVPSRSSVLRPGFRKQVSFLCHRNEILNFGTKLACRISTWVQGMRVLHNARSQPCTHVVTHAGRIVSILLIAHFLVSNEY